MTAARSLPDCRGQGGPVLAARVVELIAGLAVGLSFLVLVVRLAEPLRRLVKEDGAPARGGQGPWASCELGGPSPDARAAELLARLAEDLDERA